MSEQMGIRAGFSRFYVTVGTRMPTFPKRAWGCAAYRQKPAIEVGEILVSTVERNIDDLSVCFHQEAARMTGAYAVYEFEDAHTHVVMEETTECPLGHTCRTGDFD